MVIETAEERTALVERRIKCEVTTSFIYVESFNARLGDELLNGEFFYTVKESGIIIEQCGGITTPSGHIQHSVTGHPRRKQSSPGATIDHELIFELDQSIGADQARETGP
jgi:hypothetical protein